MSSPFTPEHPWSAEIEPTAELVSALVARHWPDLAGPTPVPVGRGWENAVWAVGDWLVRLPLRANVVGDAENELAALHYLAPRLPVWVPLPERISMPDAHYPYPAWLVARAPGHEAEHELPDGADAAAIARSAGAALSALHALDRDAVQAHGFVNRGEPKPVWKMLRHSAAELPTLATEVDGAVLSTLALVCTRAEIERPENPNPPVPCHRDLRGTHVFTSRDRVTALIDWTDAGLDDPAIDFAGLWLVGGEAFMNNALAAYTGAIDPALAERIRLHVLVATVTTLRYGVEADKELERMLGHRLLRSLLG
jgi:aminoglycoside phosphotransferase (APT) family kinase protein